MRQATLQVADNAPASPQSLTLNGTGTSVNTPAVTITPSSLSFTATQGATSAPMNLTVTNSGTAPLHVTSVTFGGPDVAEFVNPASSCTVAIAPSASCTIAVSFAPVSAMSATHKTETILIADDATNSPQSVTVTGTINASAFTVSNASSLTATVTAGQTAQYNVQLTPGPGFSGTVTMACSGAPAGAVCTVANPITLTSGSPTTFAVSLTTTARSFLIPNSNRQPLVPSAPYLLLFAGLCVAMLALLHKFKVHCPTQPQLAYSTGVLVLVLIGAGLAGCASSGVGSGSSGSGGTTGTQKGTYTLTLTPTTTNTGGKTVQVPAQPLTLIVN
jgi:hypothetical protein